MTEQVGAMGAKLDEPLEEGGVPVTKEHGARG